MLSRARLWRSFQGSHNIEVTCWRYWSSGVMFGVVVEWFGVRWKDLRLLSMIHDIQWVSILARRVDVQSE